MNFIFKNMDKENITPVQRFWRLLKPDVKEIKNIYIYSAFVGLISLSLPLGIQAIVGLIQVGQTNTSWIILVVFVILGIIATGVLKIFQMRITENIQQKIFTRAAFEFSYRIKNIKMEALYKHYAPELMNRFLDIVSIQKGLPKILIEFSSAFFIVIFSLILLSLYHPFFILFSVLLLMLVYFIFQFTAKRGLVTSIAESSYKYQIIHWLEELSRTAITFKFAGKSDYPLKKTDYYTEKYLSARQSHFKILILQYSLAIFFKVLVATGLLAIGGVLVMNQQLNVGQFVAAEIIILVVMASVEKLVLSAESIYDILTSLEKIGQVTDLELDRDDGIDLEIDKKDKGMEVEIENLSFSYPGLNTKTLNNISLKLKKGEMILLNGEGGSGKSTLLYIISGLYQPQEGVLCYNKLPIGNLKLNSIREHVGEYMTMVNIFEGTVIENITLGREMAIFKNVKWAVENLGLSNFIRSLPKGYNTKLNAEGKGLPESIVTKLLIARCIVTKPKLILLENTFERLDDKSTKEIIDFITDKKNGWSIVAVSSNSYLAKSVDKIVIMKNGEITQTGTYSQLKDIANFKTIDNA